jgi:AcrR family transcriptional regulator
MTDPVTTARRAPFSDNPTVGNRGQRTQQRILDAALAVFGEEGYHQASVGRIAERAGCSRVSFYQYFSKKEDVFSHLAGQVVRQVSASVEALDTITPDAAGWATVREWVARYADIFERYEPVFHAYSMAAEDAEAIAAMRSQAGVRNVSRIHSKIVGASLPGRELDAMIGLLLEAGSRAYYNAEILRRLEPDVFPRDRVEDALADVMHRCFFGLLTDVNVHVGDYAPVHDITFDPAMPDVVEPPENAAGLTEVTRGTLESMLASGVDVFVTRGYHGTRVDDIVAAAGLSHGAFYGYFRNKAHFARTLVLQAMEPLSETLAAIPSADEPGRPTRGELRAWLRTYNAVQVSEAAIILVWIDATLHEPELVVDAAAAVDWGRRRLSHFLHARSFGDHEAEAVVLMAVLDAFGARPRHAGTDATAQIIERGLLGR